MSVTPLVLIHGYPFDHTMWFSTIASLGANAQVIAPDLPGFGKAPVLNKSPSMEAYADFIAQLLNDNGREQAIVAGMSMGGYIALAFAEKYPERVRGLGIISSQAAADTPETRQARMQMITNIRENGPSVASDAILPKLFSGEKAKKPELTKYPVEGANAAGVAGLCWALEAMAKRPDRTLLVKSLRSPVLLVHGSEDKIVPITKARELAVACKGAILDELSGIGHASPLEAPDQVAQALIRLIEKAPGEAAPPTASVNAS